MYSLSVNCISATKREVPKVAEISNTEMIKMTIWLSYVCSYTCMVKKLFHTILTFITTLEKLVKAMILKRLVKMLKINLKTISIFHYIVSHLISLRHSDVTVVLQKTPLILISGVFNSEGVLNNTIVKYQDLSEVDIANICIGRHLRHFCNNYILRLDHPICCLLYTSRCV